MIPEQARVRRPTAGQDIGPPRQLLDLGIDGRRISVPIRLIGSPGQSLAVWCTIKASVDCGHDVPSNDSIAKRCGTSPSSVTRAMVWLRKEGFLA